MIKDIQHVFAQQRKLAEAAAAQVNDQQFFQTEGSEANSIAIVMKHVGGNLRSRWTDFLTTDGEKPDRNRDGEFIAQNETRDSVMRVWNDGWQQLDATLATLTNDSLSQTVTIRGEPCTVQQALLRNLAHASHHAGQIVHIAKVWAGADWKTLSIPRNESARVLGNFWSGLPQQR
jgi:hypothetical protein